MGLGRDNYYCTAASNFGVFRQLLVSSNIKERDARLAVYLMQSYCFHFSFSADNKNYSCLIFQAVHNDDSEDWVLKIREARTQDSGMYECQVSTQPVRSYFVHLLVGGNDYHQVPPLCQFKAPANTFSANIARISPPSQF